MEIVEEAITRVIEILGLPKVEFVVEHPVSENHGDYASNVAILIFAQTQNTNSKTQTLLRTRLRKGAANSKFQNTNFKTPRELAELISEVLRKDAELSDVVSKIEVAGAGFINFWLTPEWLVGQMGEVVKQGKEYGSNAGGKGKRIMVEYTDPNPFKEFHIGHLMSNTIGEAIARLLDFSGAEVKRVNYQGDVGMHVAKSLWGMREKLKTRSADFTATTEKAKLKEMEGWSLQERQKFMGQAYAEGATAFEESEEAKAEMTRINKAVYEGSDPEIMALYEVGRQWSLAYFETIYARLGTTFDEYFFESEAGKAGLVVVEEGLAKGVLEEGEGGAVVYKGEKDGLHTRVFRNQLGLSTYEAKDLGLAKTKYDRYPYDFSYIITANEIDEYFKVVLTVMRQLYPDLATKTIHLSHGMMKLSSGKMSSRTGKVVTGEGLLDELKDVVLAKMGDREVADKARVADMVAVGAMKYVVLKQAIGGDIVYQPEMVTSLEGNTGPYLQYTYVRTQSVLAKSETLSAKHETHSKFEIRNSDLNSEELSILRWLYRFPEVVVEAASEYAPNRICTYLFELASRYNGFYNKHRILPSEETSTKHKNTNATNKPQNTDITNDLNEEQTQFRLVLTRAVGQVVKNGLGLLGIEAPSEM